MAASLPVIDFAAFIDHASSPEEKKAVALQIDNACREVGFFYLKNHGVPMNLIGDMLTKSRNFFETATPEEKKRLALRKIAEGGDNARGFLKINNPEKGSHEV